MLTVFNEVVRRGHRPRDPEIRKLMVDLGLPVPEQLSPRNPELEDESSSGEDEGAEEEDETEDEPVPEPLDFAATGGHMHDVMPVHDIFVCVSPRAIPMLLHAGDVSGSMVVDAGNDSQMPPPVLWPN